MEARRLRKQRQRQGAFMRNWNTLGTDETCVNETKNECTPGIQYTAERRCVELYINFNFT
jgi:hypothetical protein